MAVAPIAHEKAVLSLVAGGDERAFGQLFLWYSRPLGEFVQQLTKSLELTEEIIQDVFIVVWQRRNTLAGIDNFSHYLFVLCRNRTYTVLKKLAADQERQSAIIQQQLLETEWEQLDNPAEAYREQLSAAVEKLPEQQRRAYSLSRYQRLKYEEIAVEMGISAETVKKHIQAAIRTIRQELGNADTIGIWLVLMAFGFIS